MSVCVYVCLKCCNMTMCALNTRKYSKRECGTGVTWHSQVFSELSNLTISYSLSLTDSLLHAVTNSLSLTEYLTLSSNHFHWPIHSYTLTRTHSDQTIHSPAATHLQLILLQRFNLCYRSQLCPPSRIISCSVTQRGSDSVYSFPPPTRAEVDSAVGTLGNPKIDRGQHSNGTGLQ